jgi:nitronate monooxygenase
MLTFYKGMKAVEKAALSSTYATVWCAGPSIEFTKAIRPVKDIVEDLVKQYHEVNDDPVLREQLLQKSIVDRGI